MTAKSDRPGSPWVDGLRIPNGDMLKATLECDVCVIGAGISGLTTAYLLAKAGKDVIVLEKGKLALSGETARTTAHLSPIMDDGLARIEKLHGLPNAKRIWESHAKAIDLIEEIILKEKIDCDFLRLDGYLAGAVEDEFDAAKRMGIPVEKIGKIDFAAISATTIKFPNQAQFHALKYLNGLARAILALGGKIFSETAVTDIEWKNPAIVKTDSRHHIHAPNVVEASNSLVTGSMRTITKLYPYRTYAIALQIPRQKKPFLFWDTEDPYHYVRTVPGDADHSQPDLLIVGGEDHKTGQADDAETRYENLEAWARKRWPEAQAVTHRWSGQVLETPDGIALIGRNPGNPEHSHVVTGDSGHGMTHGTLGGMILSDAILGRPNPYSEIYSPSRLKPGGIFTWLKENANEGRQYLDWIPYRDTRKTADIPEGEGAIVQDGTRKIAVYKDAHGKLSACSAVCPHLGGIVRWNSGEKSWDCPCHGSRFDRFGKALCTPTVADLAPARIP